MDKSFALEGKMHELRLAGLKEVVAGRIKPFLEEAVAVCGENMRSISITGSALTDDFDPTGSDINSVFVLKEMDLKALESLAPLGKRHRKRGIAAPLIMTPGYIEKSRDVFPVEFLNIKLLHETVYGEDIFASVEIGRADLRRQCERELRAKLLGLRQGYLFTMGDRKALAEGLISSIRGYIPLFRGIIKLLDADPPLLQADVIKALAASTGCDCGVFERALRIRREKLKLSVPELNTLFEEYYRTTEKLASMVDEIKG